MEEEEKEEDKQGENEINWFNKIIQFASLGLGLKLYDKKLINGDFRDMLFFLYQVS